MISLKLMYVKNRLVRKKNMGHGTFHIHAQHTIQQTIKQTVLSEFRISIFSMNM